MYVVSRSSLTALSLTLTVTRSLRGWGYFLDHLRDLSIYG